MSQPKQKTLRIIGAGGFGVNIVSQFMSTRPQLGCDIEASYFDTSRSNLPVDSDHLTYLVPDVDGAGKQRAPILPMVQPHIEPALRAHPPKDFNLVVFSASGGSGSVAGPLLVNELMKRGHQTVVLVLGDTDSGKSTDNTIKTLATLSALTAKQNQPLIAFYRTMQADEDRRKVDDLFVSALRHLGTLIATTGVPNSELDTSDVKSWLHYHKTLDGYPPSLSLLNIYGSNEEVNEMDGILAMTSLYTSPDHERSSARTSYRATGYNPLIEKPVHYVVTQAGMNAQMDSLKRRLEEIQNASTRLVSERVSFHTAGNSDDFMIV